MVDNKQRNITLKKLARWAPSSSPSQTSLSKAQTLPPLSNDAPFVSIHHDNLQQGALYIIKIKQVSLALFEGWNDDMCCFSILRSEVEPLRWSDARQLPGDFDIYNAFDECGNPPIHLWSRYLRVGVPSNWFSIFEEAKRKQRQWTLHQEQTTNQQKQEQEQEQEQSYYYQSCDVHADESMPTYANADVSSMVLNSNTIASPSMEVIDPRLINEDLQSTTTSATTTSAPNSDYNAKRSIVAPIPSSQPFETTQNIIDREQIRRHVAPGQALKSKTDPLPLIHHKPREYYTQNQVTPLAALNNDEIDSNTFVTEVEFPHDSDRFSIQSGTIQSTETTQQQPFSSKIMDKPLKKQIWG
ncbi:hypothetical protein BD408DRAFT_413027 [Parasitella parasitica]|nr:hypothetical protein BD408DRAFT_413027 [Parasitella parasitica]